MEIHADREPAQARRFARVPFDTTVRLTRLATGQTIELPAVNLSENGVFLETVVPFPVGELVRLSVPDAPSNFAGVAAARVAWRRPFSVHRLPGQPPGFGLAFLFMSLDDRESLRELVESGGIAPQPSPLRAPVAPRIVEAPLTLPTTPSWGTKDTLELLDVGPFGWLLVIALAMAALTSLLLGMQPNGL